MSYSGFPFAEFDCIALGYLSSPTRQLFALHGKIWNVAKRVYGVLEKLWKDRGGNMPEVILPCPATMSDAELLKLRHRFDDVCQSSTTPELFELCRAGSHLVDAIRSLPRSLTWTHEPPKVAGDCYVRTRPDESEQWDKPFVVFFSDGYLKDLKPTPLMQFAGPIPLPVEG